jgi:hypothetical protein
MSEDEWLQQRNDIVEDLKLRFRQNQIEQEGNDPAITGESFGTPHDLASMHMSSDDVEQKDKGIMKTTNNIFIVKLLNIVRI